MAYKVENFYSKEGFCSGLAQNPYFENFTLLVIASNAIWIAVDTDYNAGTGLQDAATVFVVADCMFFGYFFFELAVRFGAFESKIDCVKDRDTLRAFG